MFEIFKTKSELKCKVIKHGYMKDIIQLYDIKQLLIEAILDYHKKTPRKESVRVIGCYVDEDDSKLYIASKYILSEGKSIPEAAIKIYTGLFIGEFSTGTLKLRLHYCIIGYLKASYKLPSLSKNKIIKSTNHKIPSLVNIDLYNSNYLYRHELRYNKAKDLDLAFDDNTFFSLKYHRRSRRIIKEKQYIIQANLHALNDVLLLDYKYSGSNGIKNNNFMIVLKELLLVGKMKKMIFVQ
jgi:hypothetical protein